MRHLGVLLAVVLILVAVSATARTWRVEKDGSGDYTVIQDALDAAASGDTVLVGPGRFDTFRTYPTNGGDREIIAKVEVAQMTIVGSGRTQTFVGPETYEWQDPDPHTRCIHLIAQPTTGFLRVRDLAVENAVIGVYLENAGRLFIDNCEFSGGRAAVTTYSSSLISNSRFTQMREPVHSFPPADSVIVEHCEFDDNWGSGVKFQLIPHGIVRDCTFLPGIINAGGVFHDRSGGGIYDSRFTGMDVAITFWDPYLIEVMDNDVHALWHCINSTAEAFIAERNILRSDIGAVFRLNPDGFDLGNTIRNNHILRGTGYAVEISGCNADSESHLDMSGNWWGTANADSISAWIYDASDNRWPPINCFVDFEPFLGEPVSTEKESLGGLKAMFR